MFEEFVIGPDDATPKAITATPVSAEEKASWDEFLKRVVKPEERDRLERLLIGRLEKHQAELREMLKLMSDDWPYEDGFYRYYHGSFKVYSIQITTQKAVELLRKLLPERELNLSFARIIREGTGKEFETEHNKDWDRHTGPMLEAFAHAKFMIEMAVR